MSVLCLHTVDPDWESPLALSPDAFEACCAWLTRNRRVVDLGSAVEMMDRSWRLPRGVAALTFDDGYASLYDHAFPILRHYGLPATVFVVTETLTPAGRVVDWVEPPPPQPPATLSSEQILEMQDGGVRFESHSYSHLRLPSLDDEACVEDLTMSREVLQDVLGRPVGMLAYPRGEHTERVRRSAQLAGFRVAFSLPVRAEHVGPYAIPRVGLFRGNAVPALRIKSSRWYLPVRTTRAYRFVRRLTGGAQRGKRA